MRISPSRYKVHKIYGQRNICRSKAWISPSRIQRSMIIGLHSDQPFTIKSPANLNNSPSRYKVHKIYGQSLITEYRKMGRKNFSFGLALHDKKSKIRISPSRIIDFFIRISPSRIQRSMIRGLQHLSVKSLIKI